MKVLGSIPILVPKKAENFIEIPFRPKDALKVKDWKMYIMTTVIKGQAVLMTDIRLRSKSFAKCKITAIKREHFGIITFPYFKAH